MMLLPLTGIISDSRALVREEVRRRRWPLPFLVRTRMPLPVRRKRLAVALCVLSFCLPFSLGLRGTFSLLAWLNHHQPKITEAWLQPRFACLGLLSLPVGRAQRVGRVGLLVRHGHWLDPFRV